MFPFYHLYIRLGGGVYFTLYGYADIDFFALPPSRQGDAHMH